MYKSFKSKSSESHSTKQISYVTERSKRDALVHVHIYLTKQICMSCNFFKNKEWSLSIIYCISREYIYYLLSTVYLGKYHFLSAGSTHTKRSFPHQYMIYIYLTSSRWGARWGRRETIKLRWNLNCFRNYVINKVIKPFLHLFQNGANGALVVIKNQLI